MTVAAYLDLLVTETSFGEPHKTSSTETLRKDMAPSLGSVMLGGARREAGYGAISGSDLCTEFLGFIV
jgi:hypothetical protein